MTFENGMISDSLLHILSDTLGNMNKVLFAIVMVFIFTGSVLKIDLVWELSDFFNGIMVIPNLIAILLLSGKVARLLKEYNEGIAFNRDNYLK